MDEDGRVALNSQETANAVDFLKEFWVAACDESGLAWDDTSNNRAFLAETIAVTLNGASIYFVARNDPRKAAPGLADRLGHFLIPEGSARALPRGRSVFELHRRLLTQQGSGAGIYPFRAPGRQLREIPGRQ